MRVLVAAGAAAALALAVSPALRLRSPTFPPLSSLPPSPYSLQDAALVSCGLRAAAADLAWAQMLQYTAGGLPNVSDRPGHPFEHLKDLSLRVSRLDPSYQRSTLFAAGILAWFRNVDRTEEAVEILQEGLRNNPRERSYGMFIAAIAFKQKGDVARMTSILEGTLDDPHSPVEIKSILANVYKSRGEYAKALRVWGAILDDQQAAREWPRAHIQIAEIRALMKTHRRNRQ